MNPTSQDQDGFNVMLLQKVLNVHINTVVANYAFRGKTFSSKEKGEHCSAGKLVIIGRPVKW